MHLSLYSVLRVNFVSPHSGDSVPLSAVSLHSGKAICAPHRLSRISPLFERVISVKGGLREGERERGGGRDSEKETETETETERSSSLKCLHF